MFTSALFNPHRERNRISLSFIDHNEFYDWPWAAVNITNDSQLDACPTQTETRLHRVRVARNFFHHNQKQGLG